MTCDPSVRQSNGQFAPGNPGGPGNPNHRRTALYRQAVEAAVTIEDLQQIMMMLVNKAIEGDRESAKLVLHYRIGKPDTLLAQIAAEMKDDAAAWSSPPEPTRPTSRPVAVPVTARRDPVDSLLATRREPTTEELLGITLPPSNGVNGRPGQTAPPATGTPARERSDAGRSTKK